VRAQGLGRRRLSPAPRRVDAAALGIDVHIVRRDPANRGLTVLPRRWTVERTPGRLMNHRRPARDYEAESHRSEAMVHLAMINLMTRRLTAKPTPS
jgi:transposase